MLLRLLLGSVFVALVGCASTAPRFTTAEPPSSGYARLYVFRPGFNDEKRDEVLSLALNGASVFRVAHESFSHISLAPGSYVATVRPGERQSKLWSGSTRFSVEADQT